MTFRHSNYPMKHYLSRSYDNHLQDCDLTSSNSSNNEESNDRPSDVFNNLADQIRGLKTASRSYSSIWNRHSSQKPREVDLTEQEILQVEAFFKSHKTTVFVCRSLANLYFCRGATQWELARTGVPVLILDQGETKARRQRALQIVLAEKGTGFVLWRDAINGRTNYRAQESSFHVMFVSWERGRTAGLRFHLVSAAMQFLEKVEQFVGDPRNLSLSSISTKNKRRPAAKKNKLGSVHLPRKCDISQPCCFQHVTNVAIDDKDRLYTLATLLSNRTK